MNRAHSHKKNEFRRAGIQKGNSWCPKGSAKSDLERRIRCHLLSTPASLHWLRNPRSLAFTKLELWGPGQLRPGFSNSSIFCCRTTCQNIGLGDRPFRHKFAPQKRYSCPTPVGMKSILAVSTFRQSTRTASALSFMHRSRLPESSAFASPGSGIPLSAATASRLEGKARGYFNPAFTKLFNDFSNFCNGRNSTGP